MNGNPSSSSGRRLLIDVVTDTYVPDVNGVSFSLGRLCTGLRELGHQVRIIRSGKAGSEHESAVFSWPLPGYWEIKVGQPMPGEIRKRWEQERPDAIYVAIETPLGYTAASTALKMGIPVIGGFHTNFREYLHKYGADWIGEKVWNYQRWFHERLARTLVPSPDAKEKLASGGFTKVDVLGRGVDTKLFHPSRRSEVLRKELGAKEGAPLAIVVGRVSAEKNIGLAIRAFERMKELCPDLVCVVVGDGPARGKLERDHPEVKFPGYRFGEELAACYASADLMLFPSETETFGNVLLEGMASGLPSLAYDYAAAGWHGADGMNLLKVTKGDEEAFLNAAVKLLDPSVRSMLAAGALETTAALGWPGIVANLEKIFLEVIDPK